MAAWQRIANLFHRSRLDHEISAELQAHIDLRTDDNIARGMSPEEARREAVLRFGNPTATRERVAARDSILSVERLARALRLSLGPLSKYPGFTVTAVCTLAIGLGRGAPPYSVGEEVPPLPVA